MDVCEVAHLSSNDYWELFNEVWTDRLRAYSYTHALSLVDIHIVSIFGR